MFMFFSRIFHCFVIILSAFYCILSVFERNQGINYIYRSIKVDTLCGPCPFARLFPEQTGLQNVKIYVPETLDISALRDLILG